MLLGPRGPIDSTFLRTYIVTQAATLERAERGVAPHEREEGTITKAIESYTSAVPSGTYLGLAVGAIGLSAILKLAGRNQGAQFVGHWSVLSVHYPIACPVSYESAVNAEAITAGLVT